MEYTRYRFIVGYVCESKLANIFTNIAYLIESQNWLLLTHQDNARSSAPKEFSFDARDHPLCRLGLSSLASRNRRY